MTWAGHSAALAAEAEPKTVVVLAPAGPVQVGLPARLPAALDVAIPVFGETRLAGLAQAMPGAQLAALTPLPEPAPASLALGEPARQPGRYGTTAALAQRQGEASGYMLRLELAGQLQLAWRAGAALARRQAEAAAERTAAAAATAAAATAAAAVERASTTQVAAALRTLEEFSSKEALKAYTTTTAPYPLTRYFHRKTSRNMWRSMETRPGSRR